MRRTSRRNFFSRDSNQPRVNIQIRTSPVRLIGEDGEQLGIVSLDDARERALEAGLDLVEVGPQSDPPVVRVLDWGKLKYEKDKKAKEAKKRAHVIEVKEVKYRPSIDEHDYELKTTRVKRFLNEGKKVKVTVFFKYRQLRRPELGDKILDRVLAETGHMAVLEGRSRMESRRLVMVLAPKEAHK